jgi:hypothetical protein
MNLTFYSIAESPFAYLSDAEKQKYIMQAESESESQATVFELPARPSTEQQEDTLPRFDRG